MSLMQTNVAALTRQLAGQPTAPGGTFGELLTSEVSPVYYNLVKAGKVFILSYSFAAAAVAAFAGGAAGTPIFGIYNPSPAGAGNGGVDIVPLYASVAIRTTGTGAFNTDFNWWGVTQTAAVTGTQTVARQAYSLQQGGSQAYCMANVVNTGALASNLIRPSFSMGVVAATAVIDVLLLEQEYKGSVVCAPGQYLAFGNALGLTAASLDCTVVYAELPA